MKRPNVKDEKYKLSNDFECIKFNLNAYQADINKHINQIEAEKKELIEDSLHFSEWTNLVCVRNGRHEWTYKGDKHSKKHSTSEMFEIWKTEVNKLK